MTVTVPMIDVSAYNHLGHQQIQWARVKAAGYGAVMVKATEGTTYVNEWLRDDADGAAAAGLQVGYYHYAHPGRSTAEAECEHALTAIGGLPRQLGLALDLEVQEGVSWRGLAMWAQRFHARALETVDHSPLYCNDFFLANLPGAPWGQRLWLAQSARPRQHVWAWQLTTPVAVNGIAVPTDAGYLHPAG